MSYIASTTYLSLSNPYVILPPATEAGVARIEQEWSNRERLFKNGLQPASVIYLGGEAGSGKTTVALRIANNCGMSVAQVFEQPTSCDVILEDFGRLPSSNNMLLLENWWSPTLVSKFCANNTTNRHMLVVTGGCCGWRVTTHFDRVIELTPFDLGTTLQLASQLVQAHNVSKEALAALRDGFTQVLLHTKEGILPSWTKTIVRECLKTAVLNGRQVTPPDVEQAFNTVLAQIFPKPSTAFLF